MTTTTSLNVTEVADGSAPPPTTPEPVAVPDKFKNADGSVNTDALIRSYSELEKKQSGATETPVEETTTPETPADPAAEKVEGFAVYEKEFADNGKLSDESYAALEKSGFSKADVDGYIAFKQGQANAVNNELVGLLTEGGLNENDIVAWAEKNLSEAEQTAFNNAVQGKDVAAAKLAVIQLNKRYIAANGSTGIKIDGKAPATTQGYATMHEMQAALLDPRYEKDSEYRKAVDAKSLLSTHLFAHNIR